MHRIYQGIEELFSTMSLQRFENQYKNCLKIYILMILVVNVGLVRCVAHFYCIFSGSKPGSPNLTYLSARI